MIVVNSNNWDWTGWYEITITVLISFMLFLLIIYITVKCVYELLANTNLIENIVEIKNKLKCKILSKKSKRCNYNFCKKHHYKGGDE